MGRTLTVREMNGRNRTTMNFNSYFQRLNILKEIKKKNGLGRRHAWRKYTTDVDKKSNRVKFRIEDTSWEISVKMEIRLR